MTATTRSTDAGVRRGWRRDATRADLEALIAHLARRERVSKADAARDLLRGLAAWFGIDFTREAERATGEDESRRT